VIYPLHVENGNWDKWIKIGLLVIFGFTVISIIVNLVKGIRYLVREPEAL
jgi:phosphatidylglycerophosphate synthase